MMHAGSLCCLILLVSVSLVSSLCSTCLQKHCHDNGECIIGCVPGYVGQYCDENCPSGCLNKACHLSIKNRTVTCTDGCIQGYCDIQCDLPCPGDCATCDRQCDSCNVTLCPERRYGNDCSRVCDERYGKCDRETGQCVRCIRGYYGQVCTAKCPECFTHEDIMFDKCLSYCDNCKLQGTCPAGFHGDACEVRCSPGCEKPGCNRATGECSTRCVSGYHGLTCNYTCSDHCLSGRCNRATGECSTGCVSGYHGLTCNYTCSRFCVGGVCNQHDGVCTSGCISGYEGNLDTCEQLSNGGSNKALAIAVPIIVVSLVAVMVTAAVIWRRRRYRRSNTPETQHVEDGGETVPMLPHEASQTEAEARTKDEIKVITAGMIRVSAVDIVLEKLKAGQRWVTITGNAGDGKTVLGYMVLKEFLQKNVNVFTVDKPEEYDEIAKMNVEKVIMFDDRFGAFLADEQLIKNWLDVIRKCLTFNENDGVNSSVIFLSRKNVVNESRKHLGKFTDQMFDPNCVVDLSKRKVTEERLEILEYHLHHENVTVNHELKKRVADKDIAHGFPHCCKMYSKLRSNGFDVDIEEFFESPLKFLDMTTQVLYKDNCKDLFQLMVKNDGEFDVYTITDEDKRQELLQVEKEQEGSYITKWKNGICQFAHPSVYESVLNVINDIDPLYCVQFATLSVIRQKMIISTSDDEDSSRAPCYIIVKPIPAVLEALAERFREHILKGDYSVFEHTLCKSREFSEALVSSCVTSHKEENGSKQFINQPGEEGDTMMLTAAKRGHMAAVQSLVKAGADIDIPNKRGKTTLHYMCLFFNSLTDREDTIQSIITEGRGDVNICDQYGQTPLHCLCKVMSSADGYDDRKLQKVLSCVKFIITEGRGDVNLSDKYGQTPLHYLFKCQALSSEEVKWIITEGRGDVNICDQYGQTPLHCLCQVRSSADGHDDRKLQRVLSCVKFIITEKRVDINMADKYGQTPLHYLFKCQVLSSEEVNWIITEGRGDVNNCDQYGQTPLHCLCQERSSADGHDDRKLQRVLSCVQFIITVGRGDVNLSDIYGQTPLHYLFKCQALSSEEIKWIITDAKGDLNQCEQHKSTPLHYLCAYSGLQPDAVDLVINEGKANFNTGDEHGTTPFHYLSGNDNVELDVVLRIVNTARGDLNKQDDKGITPLHVLCKGSLQVKDVLTFIKEGDKADSYKNTPLHFLCRRRGIIDEEMQQLKQLSESNMKKQNKLGYTPLDYLNDQDDSLPWTDGMIDRSAADLVLCRVKHGDTSTLVLVVAVGPTHVSVDCYQFSNIGSDSQDGWVPGL